MNFPSREFRSDETNLPSKQTIAVASPYQVPKEPVRSNERPAAAVWVTGVTGRQGSYRSLY
jgi:hypothetical protein